MPATVTMPPTVETPKNNQTNRAKIGMAVVSRGPQWQRRDQRTPPSIPLARPVQMTTEGACPSEIFIG